MKFIKPLLCCLLLFICKAAFGSHLVGGEFQIKHLNNFLYEIRLNVYADAAGLTGPGGNEDQFVDVTIFQKQSNLYMETIRMPLDSTSFVPYINNNCQTGSISTKIFVYRLNHQLDSAVYNNPDGYYIVWERCCRNVAINNILNPGASGQVFYAEFPAVVKSLTPFIDNLPVLPQIPPEYLCAQQFYRYSMAATDPDGDSLAYELSVPMRGNTTSGSVFPLGIPGPYDPVIWNPGYGLATMIQGNPALTINPVTGMLSVTPNQAGLYVFAFVCKAYRNGLKIGEVRRDMQVKVNNCPSNFTPSVQVKVPGAGLPVNYQEGDTLFVTDQTNFCYPLSFSDQDIGQTVTVKVEPIGFAAKPLISPPSGTVVQAGQTFSGSICWADCKINSPNSVYKVNLIVTDNACGAPASDTLQLTFMVIPTPNTEPELTVQGVTGPISFGSSYNFNVRSTDADNDQVTVSMQGTGFNPAALGMQFGPFTGQGNLLSNFRWTPTCAQVAKDSVYKLLFLVKDNSCFADHTDSLRLSLKVTPPKNTKPQLSLQGFTDTAYVGIPYAFKVVSTDFENDLLSVRLAGIGFDPETEGMQFGPLSGQGSIVSDFYWNPTCGQRFASDGYEMWVILEDKKCYKPLSDSLFLRVNILEQADNSPEFLPPNLFTPNGDGFNDTFTMPNLPKDNCTDAFREIKIFNRWGQEVYKSMDRNFSWDGADVTDSSYYYLIRFRNKTYKGHVSIVR